MATCGVWCLVLLTLSVGRLSSAGPPPGQNWGKYSISCSYITYRLMLGGEERRRRRRRTERETNRQTDRQTDRKIERLKDTDRQKDR